MTPSPSLTLTLAVALSKVVPLSGEIVVRALISGFEAAHPGLVNLVQGDGEVGSYLVSHPAVDMCALTRG